MDDLNERRIEDVRGEPMDEVRFLSHLVMDRFYDRLPPEFWQHLKTARAELREAIVALLRAWLEYLTREEEAERGPVSRQRGKIVVEEASAEVAPLAPPPVAVNGHVPRGQFAPPPPKAVSRQRAKISLE